MVAEPAAGRALTVGEVVASKASLGQMDAAWAERNQKATTGGRVSMNKATAPSFLSTRYAFEANDFDRKAAALGKEHVFERKSVVSEDQLVAEALKTFCVGKASVSGVRNVVAQTPLIRRERTGWGLCKRAAEGGGVRGLDDPPLAAHAHRDCETALGGHLGVRVRDHHQSPVSPLLDRPHHVPGAAWRGSDGSQRTGESGVGRGAHRLGDGPRRSP